MQRHTVVQPMAWGFERGVCWSTDVRIHDRPSDGLGMWVHQVMMKLGKSRNLDARQSMLLDNAFYAVRPPERVGARRKRRPPAQEYARHLIHHCLASDGVKPVSNSFFAYPNPLPARTPGCRVHRCCF